MNTFTKNQIKEIKETLKNGNDVTASNFDESFSCELFYSENLSKYLIQYNGAIASFVTFYGAIYKLGYFVNKYNLSITY